MSYVFDNQAEGIIPAEKLYRNEELADVNFTFGSNGEAEKVPANKAILAVLSPVFKAMFFGEFQEKVDSDVAIVDADAEAFAEFLQFFYLNKVTITTKNAGQVARLVHKYNIDDHVVASRFCMDQLNMENMCLAYQFALVLESDEFKGYCEDEIASSPKEIFASESFLNCGRDVLKCIAGLDLICLEIDIFNACIKWAKNACRKNGLDENVSENLRIQLNDCLHSIRFFEMGMEAFTSIAFFYRGLFTPEELKEIEQMFLVKGHKSALFEQGQRSYNFWVKRREFVCDRKMDIDTKQKYSLKSEWVSFSSNKPLLLGYIYSEKLQNGPNNYINQMLNGTVKITVSETEHAAVPQSPKLIYKGESNNWRKNKLKIRFPGGILIKPHNIYQIFIKLKPGYLRFRTTACNPVMEFIDGTTVNFHRHPLSKHDNGKHSCFTSFVFINM